MCKGMNRSIISVILGGETAAASDDGIDRTVKRGSAEFRRRTDLSRVGHSP